MTDVGIRELRGNLASLTRRAGSGERIVVTIDGSPVAQLGPVEPSGTELRMADLVMRGQLVAARRDDRPAPGFSLPLWAGTRIDQLVREVRGR